MLNQMKFVFIKIFLDTSISRKIMCNFYTNFIQRQLTVLRQQSPINAFLMIFMTLMKHLVPGHRTHLPCYNSDRFISFRSFHSIFHLSGCGILIFFSYFIYFTHEFKTELLFFSIINYFLITWDTEMHNYVLLNVYIFCCKFNRICKLIYF